MIHSPGFNGFILYLPSYYTLTIPSSSHRGLQQLPCGDITTQPTVGMFESTAELVIYFQFERRDAALLITDKQFRIPEFIS